MVIGILGLLLTSCAVLHEEYFYPQATGSIVEKKWCRGNVGVDSQLLFKMDAVDVEFEVWEYKGITRLGVSFRVYDGGTAVWPSQVVIVYAGSNKQELNAESFKRLRRVSGTNQLWEKEYLVGSVMDRRNKEEFETYYETFVLAEEPIEEVKIEEVQVSINGEKKVLSDLSFIKKSGFFLHPLNC